jgi:hypothetical protein
MTHPRAWLAALLVAAAFPLQAQSTQYRTRLSPVPLDVAMQSTIAGSGSVTATLKGSTLAITGTFTGLKTAATVVRVHRAPKTAMKGPAIGDLTATQETSGTIGGSLELTKDQIADLAAGRLYVLLHSQKAPDGNLWGFLMAAEKK